MAITRRLPWPKLLYSLIWLWVALDLSRAAGVPNDQFVFPSESKENPPIQLSSRLREIDRQMEEVIRATNVTLVIPREGRKGSSRTATIENTTQEPGNTPTETGRLITPEKKLNLPTPQENKARHPPSESKMVTFVREPESNISAPWDQTQATIVSDPKSVIIGPRIVLETTKICPKGTVLTVNDHCRKIA
ncbi:uncharacterized protein LOC119549947 [Drosophila subpulchrella]|uniref:uncharacterized protein LOC119549947 n=1 Tax=Drosophila subpulchrella TaxID=1486046 RepID=UPI0018A19EFF|nr:uncharacterized protein LOC119549947 [Drosophila subpulchrella]